MKKDTRDEETVALPVKPKPAGNDVDQYTPRPWSLLGPDWTKEGRVWRINGRPQIAGFHVAADCRLADVFSVKSNAVLMVTAPELLELLKEAASYVDDAQADDDDAQLLLVKIRKVIKKATDV